MKKIIGIIVEYNPFHNGHLYQIKQIKNKYPDSLIIVCMSSCFTERGELSILNKWEKTSIALNSNVDIVIELPYIYTVQSSDVFAAYSLNLLNELKINKLCFGIEKNNIEDIKLSAKTQLFDSNFDCYVKKYMDDGINYPTAMNKALKEIINIEIKEPNELLALSYIKEIIKNNYSIDLFPVKRTSKYHDKTSNATIVSASNVRYKMLNNQDYKNTVPKEVYSLLKKKKLNNKYFEYLKYKILSENNLEKYLDVDEGLNTRIKKSILKSNNIDDLINNIKTKRYTYNKISRMLNHIFTSLTKEEAKTLNKLEYIRILGFSKDGQKYLNEIKDSINLPLLNKYDTNKYKTLEIEKRITNLYSYIYDDINDIEIKNKPIIKESNK